MTKIGQAAAAILDRAHGKLVAFHSQHGLETGFERRLRNIRTLGHNRARVRNANAFTSSMLLKTSGRALLPAPPHREELRCSARAWHSEPEFKTKQISVVK
jgi:hypothetical protein